MEIMMEVMQERMREMQRDRKDEQKIYEKIIQELERKYEEIKTMEKKYEERIEKLEERIRESSPSSVYDNAVVNIWWHAQSSVFVKIGVETLDIHDSALRSLNIDAFSSLFKLRSLVINVEHSCVDQNSEKFQQMKSSTITHFSLKNVYNANVQYAYLPAFTNLETLEIHTHDSCVPNLIIRLGVYSKLKNLNIRSTCWNGLNVTGLRKETIDELTVYCELYGITLKIE
jgi:cobalamin-dependent methionine synthase I